MPANYVLLEKLVVGAAGSSGVAFQNIPQTGYTDLLIKVSGRSSTTGNQRNAIDLSLTFNGNSTGYSSRILTGNPAVDNPPISVSNSGSSIVWAGEVSNGDSTSDVFGNFDIYIPNYTSSNYKNISVDSVAENNSSNSELRLATGIWANTAAITQVSLSAGNLVQYTSFHLYGIAKLDTTPAIAPKATGGNTIMTDGTYWYHAFLASGTFTPAPGPALSCDVLVVAGGGGGGADRAAGGGAGGYRSATSLSFSSAISVTVGAGGAGAPGPAAAGGTKGSNSVISTITSTGGGAAGSTSGGGGGSGGGAFGQSNYTGGSGNEGGFSPVEGYAGGNSLQSGSIYSSGGGGGAGGVGGNAVSNAAPGAGGIGSNAHSTWASVTGTGVSGYYAGGGGGAGDSSPSSPINGGAGGAGGGGGGGASNTVGTSGTANTGGGGGGGGNISAKGGGAGGSGIVIVRYLI
jgi:hypothetical protein